MDHRGNAEISYDIYAQSSDGVTSPITKALTDTLPTLTGNALRWTLGPMKIGTQLVTGKRSISLAFNPNVLQEGADSDTFDSVTSVDSMLQRAMITGVDPTWLDNFTTTTSADDGITGIFGELVTSGTSNSSPGTCYFYLRERNSTTGTGEDTTHIWIGLNGLVNWENIISGDPRSPSESGLAVDITDPSGNGSPIVGVTGVQIPDSP